MGNARTSTRKSLPVNTPGPESVMRTIQDAAEALDKDKHCPAVTAVLGQLVPRDPSPGELFEITLTVARRVAPPRKAPRHTVLPPTKR